MTGVQTCALPILLLEHLGEFAAASQLMAVIERVTANPALHTGDLGGTARTVEVTRAVCDDLVASAA